MDLSPADRSLVRLYLAGCFHYWEQLPDLARDYYAQGASVAQLRGCLRHLVVFAGYGPCLAATLALNKAKLLPEDTPGKVNGPPGNAFELVYGGVTDRVRANMQAADPVLQEWIRLHLYGDVYSSPGLDLHQKQLLTCAFLAEANMPDQLFGHALAGLRFGNSYDALEEVSRLACHTGPRQPPSRDTVLKAALGTLGMAYAKYCKDMAGVAPVSPEVTIQDPEHSIRLPPLPPLVNVAQPEAAQHEAPAVPATAAPAAAATEQAQQAAPAEAEVAAAGEAPDASITVTTAPAHGGGLKQAGGGAPGRPWGTSNIGRPTSMAVDVIAARMEEQRTRSGLFFAWPADGDALSPDESDELLPQEPAAYAPPAQAEGEVEELYEAGMLQAQQLYTQQHAGEAGEAR